MNLSKTEHRSGAALCRGIILTGALVAALTLHAQDTEQRKADDHTSAGGDTASCLKEAAQMNTSIIKFGQLASRKAQNAELKRFGEQLEKDHKKANEKLETIAKKHDLTLPTSVDPKCQEELTKLQGLSGSEFDKEFAKGSVQGHAMAIAKLEEVSKEAEDSDVAQYAKDMLAQMKRHQENGREVAKAVGLDQATIAALETQPPEGVGTPGAGERGIGSPETSDRPQGQAPPEP